MGFGNKTEYGFFTHNHITKIRLWLLLYIISYIKLYYICICIYIYIHITIVLKTIVPYIPIYMVQ